MLSVGIYNFVMIVLGYNALRDSISLIICSLRYFSAWRLNISEYLPQALISSSCVPCSIMLPSAAYKSYPPYGLLKAVADEDDGFVLRVIHYCLVQLVFRQRVKRGGGSSMTISSQSR